MNAQIMDGSAAASRLLNEVAADAAEFTKIHNRKPCLATVLVGDDPASRTYVRMKQNRSAEVGLGSRHIELPASTSTGDLVREISALSEDPRVDGILL